MRLGDGAAPFEKKPTDLVGKGFGRYDRLVKLSPVTGRNSGDGVVGRDRSGVLWFYGMDRYDGFVPRTRVSGGWNAYDELVGASDVTVDRAADLLARDPKGNLYVYEGRTGPNWQFGDRTTLDGSWERYDRIVGASDVTGDGNPDLVARDRAGVLWLRAGAGNLTDPFRARTRIGAGWGIYRSLSGPGDLMDDGRADLVAQDAAGVVWLYRGTRRTAVGGPVPAGFAPECDPRATAAKGAGTGLTLAEEVVLLATEEVVLLATDGASGAVRRRTQVGRAAAGGLLIDLVLLSAGRISPVPDRDVGEAVPPQRPPLRLPDDSAYAPVPAAPQRRRKPTGGSCARWRPTRPSTRPDQPSRPPRPCGTPDTALAEAKELGWIVVSMKDDWTPCSHGRRRSACRPAPVFGQGSNIVQPSHNAAASPVQDRNRRMGAPRHWRSLPEACRCGPAPPRDDPAEFLGPAEGVTAAGPQC
ncbi:VCBS repeat-containing protein [Streptomyces sp. NBC_00249]|uniref:FG-GAP repeat domain-containing protein n=1 Tax=Streptomyces sp. NBC_00249 TaxID=2975690 RepID=UPI0022559009|nr:VCBS repeat-containing protein [Streptomyces sp. NBC_00249]MCX5195753.1 VCBS repeat-containing protein [Streptomyces sp. NBC_00249]